MLDKCLHLTSNTFIDSYKFSIYTAKFTWKAKSQLLLWKARLRKNRNKSLLSVALEIIGKANKEEMIKNIREETKSNIIKMSKKAHIEKSLPLNHILLARVKTTADSKITWFKKKNAKRRSQHIVPVKSVLEVNLVKERIFIKESSML